MVQIKLYPSGLVKTEEEQKEICKVCKTGEIFEGEEYIKEDLFEDDYETLGCGVCNSFYKFPKVPSVAMGIEDKAVREIVIKLWKEMLRVNNMNEDLMRKKELFEKDGDCKSHFNVDSNPVKTSEGEFVFNTCLICKVATVKYKGKTYKDELPVLVNWVVQSGLAHEKVTGKVNIKSKSEIIIADLLGEKEDDDIDFVL
jgi:hypothetical protein